MAIEDGMSASGLKVWLAEKSGATAVVVASECDVHEWRCRKCGVVLP